jgi:hypothetical protein
MHSGKENRDSFQICEPREENIITNYELLSTGEENSVSHSKPVNSVAGRKCNPAKTQYHSTVKTVTYKHLKTI